jgi:hypothetical protein
VIESILESDAQIIVTIGAEILELGQLKALNENI